MSPFLQATLAYEDSDCNQYVCGAFRFLVESERADIGLSLQGGEKRIADSGW
jgi:hypothetical protein